MAVTAGSNRLCNWPLITNFDCNRWNESYKKLIMWFGHTKGDQKRTRKRWPKSTNTGHTSKYNFAREKSFHKLLNANWNRQNFWFFTDRFFLDSRSCFPCRRWVVSAFRWVHPVSSWQPTTSSHYEACPGWPCSGTVELEFGIEERSPRERQLREDLIRSLFKWANTEWIWKLVHPNIEKVFL